MLIQCPECELPISDKAISCPHCGYPVRRTVNTTKVSNKGKRRRLPNGFGQISEIKGRNLRKPFRAMITIGKTETGRPICKPLKPVSFFETYNDAYSALVAYNKNPYDIDSGISLSALYDKWSEYYFNNCGDKMIRQTKRAWSRCQPLHTMAVKDIKVFHVRTCMNQISGEPGTAARYKKDLRALLNKLFKYAVEYGLLEQNIMKDVNLGKEFYRDVNSVKKGHTSFNADSLNILWANSANDHVKLALIECYSGWRPAEMCDLKLSDINLEQNIMIGGMKTAAGKNRTVPIHPKIREFVEYFYNRGTEYLFEFNGRKLNYHAYRDYFRIMLANLNLDLSMTPHDCRKTFVTLAKKYHVDEYAIKRIVGHAITDITERTYTDRDENWLLSEISKIENVGTV